MSLAEGDAMKHLQNLFRRKLWSLALYIPLWACCQVISHKIKTEKPEKVWEQNVTDEEKKAWVQRQELRWEHRQWQVVSETRDDPNASRNFSGMRAKLWWRTRKKKSTFPNFSFLLKVSFIIHMGSFNSTVLGSLFSFWYCTPALRNCLCSRLFNVFQFLVITGLKNSRRVCGWQICRFVTKWLQSMWKSGDS